MGKIAIKRRSAPSGPRWPAGDIKPARPAIGRGRLAKQTPRVRGGERKGRWVNAITDSIRATAYKATGLIDVCAVKVLVAHGLSTIKGVCAITIKIAHKWFQKGLYAQSSSSIYGFH